MFFHQSKQEYSKPRSLLLQNSLIKAKNYQNSDQNENFMSDTGESSYKPYDSTNNHLPNSQSPQ